MMPSLNIRRFGSHPILRLRATRYGASEPPSILIQSHRPPHLFALEDQSCSSTSHSADGPLGAHCVRMCITGVKISGRTTTSSSKESLLAIKDRGHQAYPAREVPLCRNSPVLIEHVEPVVVPVRCPDGRGRFLTHGELSGSALTCLRAHCGWESLDGKPVPF